MAQDGHSRFGWFFVTTMTVALEAVHRQDKRYWIVVGLAGGVVMLYVTHIFSPYLNHPIGLAFMLFILPFFPWDEHEVAQDEAVEETASTRIPLIKPTIGIAFKE
jgi:hypothetical protein